MLKKHGEDLMILLMLSAGCVGCLFFLLGLIGGVIWLWRHV